MGVAVGVGVGVPVGVTVGVPVGVPVGVGVGEGEVELIAKVKVHAAGVGVTSCARGILEGTFGATGCCLS